MHTEIEIWLELYCLTGEAAPAAVFHVYMLDANTQHCLSMLSHLTVFMSVLMYVYKLTFLFFYSIL